MAEGARLESVYRGNSIEGSNPSVSALPSIASAKEGFLIYTMEQIVYILLCNDGTYYTGCTSDLEERIALAGRFFSPILFPFAYYVIL